MVLRDVRQRHARRDVIPVFGDVGQFCARASTARRPAGGTRAHLKFPTQFLWLAHGLLVADYDNKKIACRHRARSERHATRTPRAETDGDPRGGTGGGSRGGTGGTIY